MTKDKEITQYKSFDLNSFKPNFFWLFITIWNVTWLIILIEETLLGILLGVSIISFGYSFVFGKYLNQNKEGKCQEKKLLREK